MILTQQDSYFSVAPSLPSMCASCDRSTSNKQTNKQKTFRSAVNNNDSSNVPNLKTGLINYVTFDKEVGTASFHGLKFLGAGFPNPEVTSSMMPEVRHKLV